MGDGRSSLRQLAKEPSLRPPPSFLLLGSLVTHRGGRRKPTRSLCRGLESLAQAPRNSLRAPGWVPARRPGWPDQHLTYQAH